MVNKKLIIQSYNSNCLRASLLFCLNFLNKNNLEYKVFFYPTKEKTISLLKSPHVYKKFKEHYVRKISKAIIQTKYDNIKLLISKLNINKNIVNIKVK